MSSSSLPFQVGDHVRLLSGGPLLTVTPIYQGTYAACTMSGPDQKRLDVEGPLHAFRRATLPAEPEALPTHPLLPI